MNPFLPSCKKRINSNDQLLKIGWSANLNTKKGIIGMHTTLKPLLLLIALFCLVFSAVAQAGTTSYQYDEFHRLKQVERPDGTVITYTYDNLGNRTSKVVVSSISATVAAFSATPQTGAAPLLVTFSDQSTGNITSWSWDFDGNDTVDSMAQNPSHTYSTPGTYTVALTVSGPNDSDVETKNAYITVTTVSSSNVLSVAVIGEGAVTSSLPGINCGVDCQETYQAGAIVSLEAAPAAHYAFIGWSGDYVGTVTPLKIENMQANVTVLANFATDADGDGIADMYDRGDSDGDGFSDMDEVQCGSDPANPTLTCNNKTMPWLMLLLK